MPTKRKRPRVVLCATLTADGKLASVRHVWPTLYDEAAGILEDLESALEWEPPEGAGKPTVMVNSELIAGWSLAERRKFLLDVLQKLRAGFPRTVLCLSGAELFRALLEAGLADELCLLVRPVVDGRRGSASLSGVGGAFFPASVACRLLRMEPLGDECLLHYRIKHRRHPG